MSPVCCFYYFSIRIWRVDLLQYEVNLNSFFVVASSNMVTLEWLCACLTLSLLRVVLISTVTITFDANHEG